MPVKATFGDLECLGEGLDPHRFHSAIGQGIERSLDPDRGIEPLRFLTGRLPARHCRPEGSLSRLTVSFLYHTVPYVKHTPTYGSAITRSEAVSTFKPRDPDW